MRFVGPAAALLRKDQNGCTQLFESCFEVTHLAICRKMVTNPPALAEQLSCGTQ